MPDRSLFRRIHSDPAYRDIIKLVSYRGMATPMREEDYQRFVEKYGKDRLIKASEELVDIDAEKRFATLKAEVRKHCRAILGPSPEEWDDFYRDVTNPPPNPYRGEKEQRGRPAERGAAGRERAAGQVAKPEASPPAPEAGEQPTELDTIRETHGRRLRLLLFGEHDRYQRHSPSEPEHQEAVRRMDLIESEMRRRGNKVPPRPAWTEPYTHPEDEVPAGSEQSNDRPSEKIGKDASGFRPFSAHTTQRLRELLDVCEYEVAKYGPETVTYEEAARDMALIHDELRQRKEEEATWISGRS